MEQTKYRYKLSDNDIQPWPIVRVLGAVLTDSITNRPINPPPYPTPIAYSLLEVPLY